MPHFPNYRLGVTPTYPCDPTIDLSVGIRELKISDIDFTLSPNPTSGTLTLVFPEGVRSIVIANTLGQVVKQWEQAYFPVHWEIDDLNITEGLYYCTVETESSKGTRTFVVKNRVRTLCRRQ